MMIWNLFTTTYELFSALFNGRATSQHILAFLIGVIPAFLAIVFVIFSYIKYRKAFKCPDCAQQCDINKRYSGLFGYFVIQCKSCDYRLNFPGPIFWSLSKIFGKIFVVFVVLYLSAALATWGILLSGYIFYPILLVFPIILLIIILALIILNKNTDLPK